MEQETVSKEVSQIKNKGLLLPEQHSKWIYMGKQPIIVLDQELPVDNAIYLMDKGWVYGVIRLVSSNKITIGDFLDRKQMHLVSDKELKLMDSNSLFEYPFQWIDKYDFPKRWVSPSEPSLITENIEFFNSQDEVFYNLEKLIGKIREDDIYFLRQVMDGINVNISRNKDVVNMLSDDKEIINLFPHLVDSIMKLSPANFIISGKLLFENLEEAKEDIKNGRPVQKGKLVIYDISYFGV